jgi:hypothetical protein
MAKDILPILGSFEDRQRADAFKFRSSFVPSEDKVNDNAQKHEPLPVKGYTSQDKTAVDMVNDNKEIEELCLKRLDQLMASGVCDPRWLALSKTYLELCFMMMNRAVFKPKRLGT